MITLYIFIEHVNASCIHIIRKYTMHCTCETNTSQQFYFRAALEPRISNETKLDLNMEFDSVNTRTFDSIPSLSISRLPNAARQVSTVAIADNQIPSRESNATIEVLLECTFPRIVEFSKVLPD